MHVQTEEVWSINVYLIISVLSTKHKYSITLKISRHFGKIQKCSPIDGRNSNEDELSVMTCHGARITGAMTLNLNLRTHARSRGRMRMFETHHIWDWDRERAWRVRVRSPWAVSMRAKRVPLVCIDRSSNQLSCTGGPRVCVWVQGMKTYEFMQLPRDQFSRRHSHIICSRHCLMGRPTPRFAGLTRYFLGTYPTSQGWNRLLVLDSDSNVVCLSHLDESKG